MPKKEIKVGTKTTVKRVGQQVTDETEAKIPYREGEPEIPPPGWKEPKKTTIYLYDRDLKLIKQYQKELKKLYGNISASEIIRFALNTMNIKRFKTGY